MRSAAIVARLDISERCADNARNLLASQVPRAAVARVLAKAARAVETQTKCHCCGQVGHRRPDCKRRNESCSLCGKREHLSHVDLLVGTQVLGLSRWNPLSLRRREKNSTRVGTVSLRHFWNPVGRFVVCDNSQLPSDESGNLLNMIMDSGVEEHVVSLADSKSLGEPLLKPA